MFPDLLKIRAMEVTVALLLGVVALAAAAEEDCDVRMVSQCYNSLVHYEGLGFPLYGKDDEELDETCSIIGDSFACINHYVATCNGKGACDKPCQEMMKDIGIFSLNTGLQELYEGLCAPGSVLRLTYLENYHCLEDNANEYAACHNESQLSQEFQSSIKDLEEARDARCCFFSWYQDCFTNITRERCNDNATVFVSYSLHRLVGHIAQHICSNSTIVCSRPPLPQTPSSAIFHAVNHWLILCIVITSSLIFSIK